VNHQINAQEVRLIDENGEQVGVVSIKEAMAKAKEADMDLVEIAPQATPPVCRILEYGKFRFEQKKKTREMKKKQKVTHLKEIQLRPNIEQHDYNFKMKHLKEFLEKGDKVKVSIQFRGREMQHTYKGQELINKILEELGDEIVVEKEAKLEGRRMIMIIARKSGN
jgi:translation initiation factor IF-3